MPDFASKRCFVALEPDEVVRADLAEYQQSLDLPGLRMIAPENLHLTIKFLGPVFDPAVEQVIEAEKLAPKQLLVASTDVIKGGEETSGFVPSLRKFEEPKNPNHGHKVEARNGTGAYARWFGPEHGHGGKWGVYTGANVCVGLDLPPAVLLGRAFVAALA